MKELDFQAFLRPEGAVVTYQNRVIMDDLRIRLNFISNFWAEPTVYLPEKTETEGDTLTIHFRRQQARGWMNEVNALSLSFKQTGACAVVYLDVEVNHEAEAYNFSLSTQQSALVDFAIPGEILSFQRDIPYFLMQTNARSQQDITNMTEILLAHADGTHLAAAVCPRAEGMPCLTPTGLRVDTLRTRVKSLHLPVLTLCASASPYEAMENVFAVLCDLYGVLPIQKRTYPACLEGFGWCTWDAFYRDVTEEGILQKMEEFRQKKNPVSWVLIDDGWSLYTPDRKLTALTENKEKFPHGLKGCIETLKQKYGVKNVGVWHALTGYWRGIEPESEAERATNEYLFCADEDWILPGETEEKAFGFFDTWHGYLAAQGVDFVKIDNQAAFFMKFDFVVPNMQGHSAILRGMERSVQKHFGGAVINCMGADLPSCLSRQYTAIDRNSDDFSPKKQDGLAKHVRRNAYNALWHGEMHVCDFDMFWSEHENAVVGAVLRAISGGPVYVSDKVGHSDESVLAHLYTADGVLPRFDHAGRATADCLYIDCVKEKRVFKVFNRAGDAFALAAFGLSEGADAKGAFTLTDLRGAQGEYLVHDFFEDRWFLMNEGDSVALSQPFNTVKLFSLYPVRDGKALVGDKRLYAEAAGERKEVIAEDVL